MSLQDQPHVDGSPAHAGIDLYGRFFREGDGGFPRTRGDRPYTLWEADTDLTVPPHTRG